MSVATYSVDEFMVIVRALRDRCTQPLMCAAVKTHIAIEQWQLVSYSGAALRSEAIAQATEDNTTFTFTRARTRARTRTRTLTLTLTLTR